MRVVIMGSGRTGSLLAGMLSDAHQEVTVIDWNASAFSRLPESYSGMTIQGNALDQDVLRRAGLESADAFVAATSGDNRNIVAGQIALTVFQVPRVVARIKDPDRAAFFCERGMKVDCRTTAGSEILLELVEKELSEQAL